MCGSRKGVPRKLLSSWIIPYLLDRFKHVAPDAYLRSGDPKEGIDDGAELDLYADPPRGFAQYVKTVRDLSADKLWDLFQHDEYVKAARDEQDPPWDPIQCVAAVGWQDLIEKLTANHSMRPCHNR